MFRMYLHKINNKIKVEPATGTILPGLKPSRDLLIQSYEGCTADYHTGMEHHMHYHVDVEYRINIMWTIIWNIMQMQTIMWTWTITCAITWTMTQMRTITCAIIQMWNNVGCRMDVDYHQDVDYCADVDYHVSYQKKNITRRASQPFDCETGFQDHRGRRKTSQEDHRNPLTAKHDFRIIEAEEEHQQE